MFFGSSYFEHFPDKTRLMFWVNRIALVMALAATALFTVRPFLGSNIIGSDDAISYHTFAYDLILQARAGVFPPYTGSTVFNFTGYPSFIWAAFMYAIVLMDALTLHGLAPAAVFNLTTVLFGVVNVVASYLALRWVTPRASWFRLVVSALFALSPASLSPLYTHDMYPTFAANGLILVCFAALFAMAGGYRPRAAVAVGLCLSIAWMCHAPTAILLVVCVALFWLTVLIVDPWRTRVHLANGLTSLLVFILTACWYFVSLLTEHVLSQRYTDGGEVGRRFVTDDFVSMNLAFGRTSFLGTLLPVDPANRIASVQLGYSLLALGVFVLWALAASGRGGVLAGPLGFRSWRGRARWGVVAGLLACLAFLLVITVPVPRLYETVLSWLPGLFDVVGALYQRIYRFLAALLCVLAVAVWARCANRPLKIAALATICPALLLWSAHEAAKLVAVSVGLTKNAAETARIFDPNSAITVGYAFMGVKDFNGGKQHFDPILKDVVTDAAGRLVAGDAAYLRDKCRSGRPSGPGGAQPLRFDASLHFDEGGAGVRSAALASFPVPRGERLALLTRLDSTRRFVEAQVEIQILMNGSLYSHRWIVEPEPYVMAVMGSARADGRASAVVLVPRLDAPLTLSETCVVPYDHAELPIRPLSSTAYAVRVATDRPATLTTHVGYLPGLQATVNGRPVRPGVSPNHYATIPLEPGDTVVSLAFVASPAMRALFPVSALAILGSLLALARRPSRPLTRLRGGAGPGPA